MFAGMRRKKEMIRLRLIVWPPLEDLYLAAPARLHANELEFAAALREQLNSFEQC